MPAKKVEPLKSFRFLVEVEGGQKKIVAAFSQFSGVKMQIETVPVRSGSERRGVLDCVPALTDFQDVTLSRGVIGDEDFLEWIYSVAPGPSAAPTGKHSCRTINVISLDDRGKPAITWSLLDAMPVAYELGGMDSSQSAVLSETLSFTIAGFKRVKH